MILLNLAITQGEADRGLRKSLQHVTAVARIAERGGFQSLSFFPSAERSSPQLEGGMILSYLAQATRTIGLVSGVQLGFEHPYQAARRLAALDHASGGRCGWAIHCDEADSALTKEYVELVRTLWDGWDDGALLLDAASGTAFAPGGISYANHSGTHFRVRGPLPLSRSPQGRPPLFVLTGEQSQAALLDHSEVLITPAATRHPRAKAPILVQIGYAPPTDALPANYLELKGSNGAIIEMLNSVVDAGVASGFSLQTDGSLTGIVRFVDEILPNLQRKTATLAASTVLRTQYALPAARREVQKVRELFGECK